MPFDPTTSVPINEQGSIRTTTFDASNSKPLESVEPIKDEQFSFITKGIRFLTNMMPVQQVLNYSAVSENMPAPLPGEGYLAYYKRADAALKPFVEQHEKDIMSQGVGKSLEVPMTAGLVAGAVLAPVETAIGLGLFSAVDPFVNLRRFVENRYPDTLPVLKDMAELVDLAAKGILIGGSLHLGKTSILGRMENLKLPKTVEITPTDIIAARDSDILTPEAKSSLMDTLGITDNHVQIALDTNRNLSVPVAKVMDLAGNPHWDAIHAVIKSVGNESGQAMTGEVPGLSQLESVIKLVRTQTDRESTYQKVFNRFQSIENTVAKARFLGAKIIPGKDAGLSADRYLSIANQANSTLNYGTFEITPEGKVNVTGEGLRKIVTDFDAASTEKDLILREKDLNDYLISQRTIYDLQRPKYEGSPEKIVTPPQVAKAINLIDDLKAKYGGDLSNFEQTAARLYDYQKRVLHQLVDSGVLSEEKYQLIISRNPHYIPFDRIMPDETPTGTPLSKGIFSGIKNPAKKIKGSNLAIHDVLGSVVKNTYKIMDAASRNKVFTDILDLKDIPELGIKQVPPDMFPVNVKASEAGEDLTIFRPSPFKPRGNILEGFANGKRAYMEVPKNLYDAMSGLNEASSGLMVKLMSIPAHWLRTGATLTPEFIVRNPVRDQWTALLQTSIGFRPFFDSMGALADITGKSEIYNDWVRSGGSYAGFVELSRPGLAKMVGDIRSNKVSLKDLNIITKLSDLSQLMEQATRLGVYKRALGKGMSPVEAAYESRESTVNFSRRGSKTKEINAVTAFFNAGMQSLDKNIRTFRKDPAGLAAKAFAAITVPSIIFYMMNRKDPDYQEIPRWQRDMFWMFKDAGGTWRRIPKPWLYGQVFGSLPERFFEFADSKDAKSFDKLTDSLYNALSPVAGDPFSGLLPTGIKPIIEDLTNWSFFRQRTIVPEGKQDLLPSEQFSRYDSETAKALGRIFNVSPSKIENLVQGYFGGSGKYAEQGSDLIVKMFSRANGEEVPAKRPLEQADVPLVKGFTAREPIGSQSESVQNFYSKKDEITKLYNTYHKFIKEGKEKRADSLLEKHPELMVSNALDKISKNIGKLTKEIDVIIASDLSEKEKTAQIKDMERSQTEMAKEALQVILDSMATNKKEE